MKIILSNYRYFISGGPEKYLFAIQSMLNDKGHEVLPFSVRSAHNEASQHQDRFLSPIAGDFAVYANEYKKTPLTILKILARQFYCPEAFFKARSFARFSNADLVYSLQYLNKMSPAVLDGFKSTGLPVVLRVSDFGLICPQAHFFNGESVCTKCLNGHFFHATTSRCVMNSMLAGFIKGAALQIQRLLLCHKRIDLFAFPSKFTMELFSRAGFPIEKLHYLPTFINHSSIEPHYDQGDHILYFGRVVIEKGVHHLLDAYSHLSKDKPPLIIIGTIGKTPYSKNLIDRYKNEVTFLDFMTKKELEVYIRKALCVVIPSIWYDNMPNVLLETYAHGKPVIAPRHGSFLDLIIDGETGLFYEANNPDDLREKLSWAVSHPDKMVAMGRAARSLVQRQFSPENHFSTLTSIFDQALQSR